MGITSVDTVNNIITLNKRSQLVPIRGRYPFVEGPYRDRDGLPEGPLAAPVTRPLSTGDVLTQSIQVEMPNSTFETVSLRAEILQNLEVGTVVGDAGQPILGRHDHPATVASCPAAAIAGAGRLARDRAGPRRYRLRRQGLIGSCAFLPCQPAADR